MTTWAFLGGHIVHEATIPSDRFTSGMEESSEAEHSGLSAHSVERRKRLKKQPGRRQRSESPPQPPPPPTTPARTATMTDFTDMLRCIKDVLQSREGPKTDVPDTVQSYLASLGHRVLAVPKRLHEEMYASLNTVVETFRQRGEREDRGVEGTAVKGTQTTPARPQHRPHLMAQAAPGQPAVYHHHHQQSYIAPSPGHLFPPSPSRTRYTTLTTVRRETPVQAGTSLPLSPMFGAYLGDFDNTHTPGSSFGPPATPGASLTTPPNVAAPQTEYNLPSGLGPEDLE